jgi:hypothetical protein
MVIYHSVTVGIVTVKCVMRRVTLLLISFGEFCSAGTRLVPNTGVEYQWNEEPVSAGSGRVQPIHTLNGRTRYPQESVLSSGHPSRAFLQYTDNVEERHWLAGRPNGCAQRLSTIVSNR